MNCLEYFSFMVAERVVAGDITAQDIKRHLDRTPNMRGAIRPLWKISVQMPSKQ
jgi:hypothetical protein